MEKGKRIMMMCLMALCWLATANAQGKYPNGAWQGENEQGATIEGVIHTKKMAGRSTTFPKVVCNGEIIIYPEQGDEECYILIYTGTKQANGHVFTAQLRNGNKIVTSGQVAIRQFGDIRKEQPYITIEAITPELKTKPIHGLQLMMIPTNGIGIR